MIDVIGALPGKRWWWFALAGFALFLEATALYYQYVLNYLPCVVCIHIRLIVAGGLILWIVAGLAPARRWLIRVVQAGSVVLSGVFIERSWHLLATENGWTIGSCDMTLSLPPWLAIDAWVPWLFEIHEPCGVTPFVLGRISMAEALLALSIASLLVFIATIAASALRARSA